MHACLPACLSSGLSKEGSGLWERPCQRPGSPPVLCCQRCLQIYQIADECQDVLGGLKKRSGGGGSDALPLLRLRLLHLPRLLRLDFRWGCMCLRCLMLLWHLGI